MICITFVEPHNGVDIRHRFLTSLASLVVLFPFSDTDGSLAAQVQKLIDGSDFRVCLDEHKFIYLTHSLDDPRVYHLIWDDFDGTYQMQVWLSAYIDLYLKKFYPASLGRVVQVELLYERSSQLNGPCSTSAAR